MPIDTSIYSMQPSVQFDPLGSYQKGLQLNSQVIQNKLLNQGYQSNLLFNQAYKNSMRPDGSVDPVLLNKNLLTSGATVGIPDALQQATALRTGVAGASTAESQAQTAGIGTYQTGVTAVEKAMYPYLSGPNANRADALKAGLDVVNAHPELRPRYDAIVQRMPMSPGQLPQFGTALHAQSVDPTQATDLISPAPHVVNQGPSAAVIDTNPRTNPGLIGTTIPQALSPAEQAQPGVSTVVGGQPYQFNRQQTIDLTVGNATLSPDQKTLIYKPGYIPGQAAPIQPGPGAQSTGRLNVQAAPATSTALPTGSPLGQESAAATAGAGNAGDVLSLQRAANNAPDEKASLANMEMKLSKFDSGPLADRIRAAKATWNQTAGGLGLPKFDPDSIAAQEEFTKLASQIAGRQSAALGMETDAGRYIAQHSNPSEALSSQGNKDVIAMLKGNQDAVLYKNDQWQKWKAANGNNDNLFPVWNQNFNKTFSPRAFQLNYMTKSQRNEMLSDPNMTPAEQAAVMGAAYYAKKQGWVK